MQTDDGREVSRFEVEGDLPVVDGNVTWQRMVGRLQAPLGWLGRALRDANEIEHGRDPERPSEKAMRLAALEREAADEGR